MSRTETPRERVAREAEEWAKQSNGHGTARDRELVKQQLIADIQVEEEAASIAKAKAREAGKAPLAINDADLKSARPPKFAWEGRVLLGYLGLWLGSEGIGKGTFAAALLARWTRGRLRGALHGTPVNVAVIGDEDSFSDVWVPRLHAAGARLSRVKQIERPDGGYVELRRDRDNLAAAIQEHDIRVVFLDALVDHLGTATNDWHGKQVREALQPARALARELDIAIIGSVHPNKSGESFRNLVAGSVAFNAVSRSSLLLAHDPDEDGRIVVVRGKGNLAATPEALTFAIKSQRFKANGFDFDVPRAVDFRKSGPITADDLIARAAEKQKTTKREANREATQVGVLEGIIGELLPEDGEWHEARPIIDECITQTGCNHRRVTEARDALGIQYHREKKFQAPVQWRWPTAAPAQTRTATSQTSHSSQSVKTPANSTLASLATPASGGKPKTGRPTGKNRQQKASR